MAITHTLPPAFGAALPPWQVGTLSRLVEHLATAGARALAALPRERLFAAWGETVAELLDPASRARRELEDLLLPHCRLSRAGLAAALEAVLGGVSHAAADALLRRADTLPPAGGGPAPALMILAGNLPGLAVQPLLPALLAGRPALLKSARAEPCFAPFFVRELRRREPTLGEALAALSWPGGETELEAPLLAAAGVVVAYGEAETLASLARRARGRFVGHGPKASLAVLGPGSDPRAVAPGLARDIALFDQRGCLSLAAVYTAAAPAALATALADELERLGRELPAGPIAPQEAAVVQQLRAEAELRGRWSAPLSLASGTVILEPEPAFKPSPGLRTVRVHPLSDPAALPALLAPWRGRLQGVALAGELPAGLLRELVALGVSRFATPGELQTPEASWANGGLDPLAIFA